MLQPPKDQTTRFLNVDFDIWSRSDLTPLIEALSPIADDLNNERSRGRHWVSFELVKQPKSADQAIRRFGKAVLALPPRVRKLWHGATTRDINIGIEDSEESQHVVLSRESMDIVQRLSARVVCTVYTRSDDESKFAG